MNKSTGLLRLAAAAVLVGCADSGTPTDPGAAPLPPTPFVLSNPVAAGAGATVAYLSLPPGSFGDPSIAAVRILRSGAAQDIALVAGGFDPVPVAVQVGDTLQVEVRGNASGTFRLVVPVSARPVVVRVSPPDQLLRVSATDSVVVTFSEPMEASALAGALAVSGPAGLLDGGIVAPAESVVQVHTVWRPVAPFPDASIILLRVGRSARDLDGDSLRTEFVASFSTDSVLPVPPTPRITLFDPQDGDSAAWDFLRLQLLVSSTLGLKHIGLEVVDESGTEPPYEFAATDGNLAGLLDARLTFNSYLWTGPGRTVLRLVADDTVGHRGTSVPVTLTLLEPDTQPRLVIKAFFVAEFRYDTTASFWFYAPQLVVAEAPGQSGLEILGFEMLAIPGLPSPFPRLWATALSVFPGPDVTFFPELYGDYSLAFFAPNGARATGPDATASVTYSDAAGHLYRTRLQGAIAPAGPPNTYTGGCGRWRPFGIFRDFTCPSAIRLEVGNVPGQHVGVDPGPRPSVRNGRRSETATQLPTSPGAP